MDYRVLLAAPLAALMLSVNAAEIRVPRDWEPRKFAMPASPTPTPTADYEIGLDPREGESAARSLTIKSVGALNADYVSYGAAQQLAWGYGGKRVRLSGELRAEGVNAWAGLFMGAGNAELLGTLAAGAPDAQGRLPMGAAAPAQGQGWQDVSVVVDVPADAFSIDLGVVLVGEGQVWARRLRFDVVPADTPVTRTPVGGIDWAKVSAAHVQGKKVLLALPLSPLKNASLD